MALVKIGPRHQITIPKEVFEALRLGVGDVLEIVVHNGKGILVPKQLVEKAPTPKLSKREQQLLVSAKRKIAAINKNMRTAKGLSEAEAVVAAKAGLIDPDQRYWWTEEWQKGEREAQRDIEEGNVSGPFHTANDLIAHLRKQSV